MRPRPFIVTSIDRAIAMAFPATRGLEAEHSWTFSSDDAQWWPFWMMAWSPLVSLGKPVVSADRKHKGPTPRGVGRRHCAAGRAASHRGAAFGQFCGLCRHRFVVILAFGTVLW